MGLSGCIHCKTQRRHKARGLCVVCYGKPQVRTLYPVEHVRDPEPTEEELDAVIAEQRKNLPSWWGDPDPEGDR